MFEDIHRHWGDDPEKTIEDLSEETIEESEKSDEKTCDGSEKDCGG